MRIMGDPEVQGRSAVLWETGTEGHLHGIKLSPVNILIITEISFCCSPLYIHYFNLTEEIMKNGRNTLY